jgi:hypothetical protein
MRTLCDPLVLATAGGLLLAVLGVLAIKLLV